LEDARAIGNVRLVAATLRALAIATEEKNAAGRVALLEEALVFARAPALAGLAGVAADAGDLERARVLLEESEALAQAEGETWYRITTVAQLGWLAMAEHRLDLAESHFRTLFDLGGGWGGYHTVPALLGLGQVSLRRGDVEQARAVYRQLLTDLRETEPGSSRMADTLVFVAAVEQAARQPERAQCLVGASEAWHTARGGAGRMWSLNIRGPLIRGLVPVPPPPGDPALLRAYSKGYAMSLDDAVSFALELNPSPT
jgi:ATP/maltotriose-dependent transcriptional regulator MalT